MTVNRPNTTFLAISYSYPSGDLNKKYKLSGKMFSLKNDNCSFFWLYFSIVLRKNEPEILAILFFRRKTNSSQLSEFKEI